ncbi:TlpA family protein disulfide reductase [Pseudomonas sp. N3-W]|jgi:peroxiredoxin|uniref:TlpA disulfide reductase family protein n=1 Tax=Pseudomonas fungipugnans TaxID=3024217 RepID=A0ABT6QI90_9PSED|nr:MULTISPECIES: TlpA disulfide reductase family protein [unclassified Pseudomonas]MDI2590603.1 TlpA disulfide reductase family protein [Pseudomonas sp. 681]UWF47048.1 TlpA family protein disulfide reductase [Pseudomonas sp. N3-W]
MSARTLLSLLALCCNLICLPAWAIDVGEQAPDLTAKTLDGQAFDLHKQLGQVVIVNFWASWCEPCREEMPAMEAYYQQHKSEGLKIIAISMDEPEDDQMVHKVMAHYSYPAALQRDADFSGFGRVWRMPMTYVIDRQGVVRKDGSVGEPKIDLPLLDTLVTPLLTAH